MPDRQRHIRPGRLLAAVVAVLAVGVMGAGLAWACTAKAEFEIDTSVGPPGTLVKASGHFFPKKTGSRVEVRLDSSAEGPISVDGPLLGCAGAADKSADTCPQSPVRVDLRATETGGSFSGMDIKIPDRSPGVYRIVALGFDEDGELASRESTKNFRTFEITKAPPASGAKEPVTDKGNAPPPGTGGSPATPTVTSNPPTATRGSTSRGTASARRAGDQSRNGGARRESSDDDAATGQDTPPGDNRGRRSDPPGEDSAPGERPVWGLVTAPSGQPLFKDSLPSPALTDARRFGQPSGRSASGDLWSGFGSGRTPSLETRRGDDPAAAEDGGFDLGLAAGTGFLGLGLAALFGSFLVAEVRRRRKAVRA